MKLCILGAGSWAIALSQLMKDNGHDVAMWEFNPHDAAYLASEREHKAKLPGIRISSDTLVTNDIQVALSGADIICLVVPSHTVRSTAEIMRPHLTGQETIVNCAKGIENDTCKRMSEVISDELQLPSSRGVVTLSGPSHAEEVALRMPTSVVAAGTAMETAARVQNAFNNAYFRVYTSTDLVGVELGGSVKNVVAIASGICHGLGFGDNTTGALITRGLAEIVRLGKALGAQPMTFAGLSGLGDLVTTCISRHSRNRFVGERLGRGETLTEILRSMVMVAEGVKTTKSVYQLSRRIGLEMPITEKVYSILFEEKDPRLATKELMTRELKAET